MKKQQVNGKVMGINLTTNEVRYWKTVERVSRDLDIPWGRIRDAIEEGTALRGWVFDWDPSDKGLWVN